MMIVRYRHLGNVAYKAAWEFQEALLSDSLAAKAAWRNSVANGIRPYAAATENHLLLCSHKHVYTIGKSGRKANLLANEAFLKTIDATYVKTNRGGDITYHGPGQLVGYPILDLEYFFTDLGRYMRALEEVIIRTLTDFEIIADRLPGCTGVWIDAGKKEARKICAMGVRCSRWITMHGFALNINTDLSYFNHIVPCGIVDKGVTSMQRELGCEIDEAAVAQSLVRHFGDVFGAKMSESEWSESEFPELRNSQNFPQLQA